MAIYFIPFRILIRWCGAYELMRTGEATVTLQVILAATSLFSVHQREKRQKETFLASHLVTRSADSLNPNASANRWYLPIVSYIRFVHDQSFASRDDELAFRRYFSRRLRNETRFQYLIACSSALISVVSLLIYYDKDDLDRWSVINIGLVIPVGCLIGVACESLRALGPSHPERQQAVTCVICLLLSLYAFVNTLRNTWLANSTTDATEKPTLDMYLASVFFHLNMMMSRSASGILRGGYGLTCAIVDQFLAVLLYAFSYNVPTNYRYQKNHRRYWRLVVDPGKERMRGKTIRLGVDDPTRDDGSAEASEEGSGKKNAGMVSRFEVVGKTVVLGDSDEGV
ncbi:hypothetical protein HKX48_001699 [Thoreauomyces humboldtii]|nr:hypothetical protein HKX48_001699 [Thoreauomyces humboldtii]